MEEHYENLRKIAISKAGTKALEKLLTYGLELGIISERDGRDWLRNIAEKINIYLEK
jgi:hypothetical protein